MKLSNHNLFPKLLNALKKKLKNIILIFVRNLLEYDDVLNQQRTVVYNIRRDILEGEDQIAELVRDMISHTVQIVVGSTIQGRSLNSEMVNDALAMLSSMTSIPVEEYNKGFFEHLGNSEILTERLMQFLLDRYEQLIKRIDPSKQEMVRDAHKWIMLETIDQAWKQHMLNLDHLKEGISLRSWGQKNPLIEYKREAFSMFEDMMRQVRFEVVQHVFNLNIEHFNSHEFEAKRERELEDINLMGPQEPEGDKGSIQIRQATSDKVGRNVDCPCGSGKKYKKCCMLKS